jgi:hypothetical protein
VDPDPDPDPHQNVMNPEQWIVLLLQTLSDTKRHVDKKNLNLQKKDISKVFPKNILKVHPHKIEFYCTISSHLKFFFLSKICWDSFSFYSFGKFGTNQSAFLLFEEGKNRDSVLLL